MLEGEKTRVHLWGSDAATAGGIGGGVGTSWAVLGNSPQSPCQGGLGWRV